ncbi:MAG: hypothetical protein WD960_00220 [Gemmatimonadota bacterium]
MSDRYVPSSMTRIADLQDDRFRVAPLQQESWGSGDYVVVEAVGRSGHWRVELSNGRLVELAEGELLIGALGVRHATLEATGSWKAVEDDGMMHLLTAGGLLGRVTSRAAVVPELPGVRYVGHVMRDGHKVVMSDFAVRGGGDRKYAVPTVLIIGTSMSAGKTSTARVVIRRLRSMGRRVLGAKLTGAGRYRDILTMWDSGADPIYDFVDAGLPSSVCTKEEYERAIRPLLARMASAPVDVAVVEVGASPLEPYNGTSAVDHLRDAIRMTILCASDPYAVLGLRAAFDLPVDLVTGIASNTRAGVELVQNLADVPCMNVRDKAHGEALDQLLRERLLLP